jgi:hypothetical protein
MPDIETLDLSVKSYATIKRMGINTTEELKDRIEDVLLHTQKAGEEALEKLNALSVVSTEQRKQAFELHYRIISSADTAQSALWDMCKNLKEMRDSKLYKALGYKNFEDYCENEVGFSRMQAHKYIAIAENVDPKNVNSSLQIGVSKLYLLSTISESEQQEISEKVNLEETTVKQLKAEIDKLKQENKAYADRYSNVIKENNKLKNTCLEVASERNRLEEENEELRSHPVEVAVVDNSAENDRKLNEVIRSLERENMKRNEEMDRQYIEDRRKLEADKKAEIAALRKEYEKKLSEKTTAEPIDENTQRFESYCLNLYETFDRLIEFVRTHRNINYNEKIGAMIDTFTEMWEDFE